jgi:chemotaxis protein methyltransferase CheR
VASTINSTVDPKTSASNDLNAGNYKFLQDYVYRESGIVLEADKQYLLEARLLPILRLENLASLNSLCEALQKSSTSPLRQKVVDAMTTNETLWFREPVQYEALKTILVPRIMEAKGANKRLSFWSAASSSGQEIYSLAIMLHEMGLAKTWNLSFVGTDLSTQILDRARTGRYTQMEMNRGLAASLLVKHFSRQGMEWELKPEIRSKVRFDRLDLRRAGDFAGNFDVVFCRNVLIYFDIATRETILRGIRKSMQTGGILLIGGAENVWNMNVPFERKSQGACAWYEAI